MWLRLKICLLSFVSGWSLPNQLLQQKDWMLALHKGVRWIDVYMYHVCTMYVRGTYRVVLRSAAWAVVGTRGDILVLRIYLSAAGLAITRLSTLKLETASQNTRITLSTNIEHLQLSGQPPEDDLAASWLRHHHRHHHHHLRDS